MKQIFIKARDGYRLDVHIFQAEHETAVVQLIHGMEEHQKRYEPFIAHLNAHGFSVVSSDLRGHGRHAADLGFFKEKGGYAELIADQRRIAGHIKKWFPNVPLYLFAHSMGTIISRVLLQESSGDYEKAVLSGAPNFQCGAYAGILLADAMTVFRGPKYKSKLLSSLSTGAFNKRIERPKTDCDWICANEETVAAYRKDPLCGIGFTCSAYSDLFRLMVRMRQTKRCRHVNQNLKLLLLSGQNDPCTGGAKGIADSCQALRRSGFCQIQCVSYPNMRHEIIAEKEHAIVYRDIVDFYKNGSANRNKIPLF